VEIGLLMI